MSPNDADPFEVVAAKTVEPSGSASTPPPSGRRGISAPLPRPSHRVGCLVGAALVVGVGICGGSLTGWWMAERPEATSASAPELRADEELWWERPVPDGPRPVPTVEGPLAGMVVYVSAGHGYLLHRRHFDGEPLRWGLQREAWYGLIEDVYTARFVADVLAPTLEEAGAAVVALRERDRHDVALVVDDQDPGFAASGWRGRRTHDLAVGSAVSELEAGGRAQWRLTTPEEGHWYLYGRWHADPRHDAWATYTVVAGDQVVETVVDQRAHGGHWWKLADLCLPAGTEVEVTLTGSGGGWLSADAVRMGGGSLVWGPPPDFIVRSHRYADVAFAHQHDWLGGPDELRSYDCGTPRSDMRTRPHWVRWASPPGEEAVYLSIHTNGGRQQGAVVFSGIDTDPPTPPVPGSDALASLVEQRMVAAGRVVDPSYRTLGWRHGDYSEVSPLHNPLPGALVELAYHDHPKDAARLKNPRMQRALAEGIVEGLIAWRQAGGVKAAPVSPRSSP